MDTIKKIHSEICVFDLECVPDTDAGRRLLADELFTGLDGETLTADEASDAQIAEKMIEQFANPKGILKTVLYKVVTIATVIRQVTADGVKLSLRNITLSEERDERAVIRTFMTYLGTRRPQVVGYATSTFDLGILWQRAIALGVNVNGFTQRPAKPWDEYADYFSSKNDFNVDLLKVLGNNSDTMPRLAQIASVARIPCKLGGVSGQGVLDLYLANELQQIADYCEDDACATYLLWLQCIASHGLFNDAQIEIEKQLFINMLNVPEKPHCIAYRDEYIALNTEHVEEISADESCDHISRAFCETNNCPDVGKWDAEPDEKRNEAAATKLDDLVTAKQLNMIRAIAHEAKIDETAFCFERFHCKPDELSKRAASDFIDLLQAAQRREIKDAPRAAPSKSGGASKRQIGFARSLAKDRKLDLDTITIDVLKKPFDDSLSVREVSLVIDTLQNAPGESIVTQPLFTPAQKEKLAEQAADDEFERFDTVMGTTRYRFRVLKADLDAKVRPGCAFTLDAQKNTVVFVTSDSSTKPVPVVDLKLDAVDADAEDDIPF